MVNTQCYLCNAGCLLAGSVGDIANQLCNLLRARYHKRKRVCGVVGNMCAVFNGFYGFFNQRSYALGCLCRFTRKVTHFICHHSKALAGGARACSLNSGVQRKDIGLECDILNGFNNFADFCRFAADVCHRANHILHFAVACNHLVRRTDGFFAGFLRVAGIFLNLLRNFCNGGRKLFDAAGLLGGALAQCLCTRRYLIGAAGNLLRRLVNLRHGVA